MNPCSKISNKNSERHTNIFIQRKNRLLKVCYVPATSATFLAFFLMWPFRVLMKKTRQYAPLSSLYYLDVYAFKLIFNNTTVDTE
jgi:hypothetical protein